MRTFVSTMPKPCLLCNNIMQPGCSIWPAEGSDGVQCGRYSHLECAVEAAQQQQQQQPLVAPICKHWAHRGSCLMGDTCFYRHPPELAQKAPSPAPAAGKAAAAAAAAAASAKPRRVRGPTSKRRSNVRNKWRCSMMRRWLMAHWGPALLSSGSGVLDVAGGKGELAFELVNVSNVPATVVDPRPLLLDNFIKRLQSGAYHHKQDASSASRAADNNSSSSSGAAQPQHLKMPLTLELVAALAALQRAAAAAATGSSCSCDMQQQQQGCGFCGRHQQLTLNVHQQQGHHTPPQQQQQQQLMMTLLERCRLLIAAGMAAADRVDAKIWWLKADGHEEPPPAAAAVAAATTWQQQAHCCSYSDEVDDAQDAAQPHGKAPAAAGARQLQDSQLQQKEAWQQQQEHQEAWQQQASHQPLQLLDCQSSSDISLSLTHLQITDQQWPGTSQPKLSADPEGVSAMAEVPMVRHPDHSSSSSSRNNSSSSSKGCAAAAGDQQQLDAAIALLCNCSAVVGMHPDQATEPIVALAVALRRPFAVVPCCVYAAEFPKRKLLSDGSPVKTYEQLVEYIQQLAAAASGEYRIGVEVMPFEGKNLLVWGMPGHQEHRCHK